MLDALPDLLVERGGFEPPKAKPADLQSAPFDRFGPSPCSATIKPWNERFPPLRRRSRDPTLAGVRDTDAVCVPAVPFGFAAAAKIRPGPGAGDGTRTRNLLITNQLLYQLSYASLEMIVTRL